MLTLDRHELQSMLIEAARMGADMAIDTLVSYNYQDAAHRIGVSYTTLQRRMAEGKIRATDGRISGAELRRYLSQ